MDCTEPGVLVPTVSAAGPEASSRSAHCPAHLCWAQASVCSSLDLCFPKGMNYGFCHLLPPLLPPGHSWAREEVWAVSPPPFLRQFSYLASHSPGVSMGPIDQLRSKLTTSPFRRDPSGLCPYGRLPGMGLLAPFPIPRLPPRGPLAMLHPPTIATLTLRTLSVTCKGTASEATDLSVASSGQNPLLLPASFFFSIFEAARLSSPFYVSVRQLPSDPTSLDTFSFGSILCTWATASRQLKFPS